MLKAGNQQRFGKSDDDLFSDQGVKLRRHFQTMSSALFPKPFSYNRNQPADGRRRKTSGLLGRGEQAQVCPHQPRNYRAA